ncbi:TolB family protein [Cohnella caldifontis]|uniref:TolB family protein n=1 Tax=Cohnella caldifontis TaxID=3027471 RepID=UPI0023EBBDE9|nr:hypothetical protein [Cohnella sp. YIM B05605]
MPNRLKGVVLSAVGLVLFTAGCGHAGNGEDAAAPAYAPVVVLDNPESASFGASEAQPLVRLDGVRGADWLTDDLLLVSKENPNGQPTAEEGTEYRPLNLYARNLATGEDTALAPGPDNQGFAVASPDRSRIFYKTFDLQSTVGTGYVMDLKTRRSIRVTQRDELELTSGVWLDDRTILYAAMDGRLVLVSADGTEKKSWSDPEVPRIGNLSAAGGKVIYSAPYGVLFSYDPETGKRTVVGKNAVWASPSADGKKLAVVRKIRGGSMELSVADADGGNRAAIAQDAQIFGLAWTPAGERLAYAGIEPSGKTRGVYVSDIAKGTTAALPIDANFIADAPRWSPSGDRLMVTAAVVRGDGGKPSFVTYLAAAK